MTTRKEIIPGTRDIANRLVDAENNFADRVAANINGTREDGLKVLRIFIKAKAVKVDLTNRTYDVKHGAFWSADVLRRALDMANA